jgi:uncharacterized protein YjiK
MRIHTSIILLACIFLFSFSKKEIPHCKFRSQNSTLLRKIPEPSDIDYDSASGHYYIVSDHGMLFECDHEGRIIRKAADEGMDFEGVQITDSFVYVSDEKPRKIYKYRKSDLSLLKTYNVSWGGGFNKAFESITYNHTKNCFILVAQEPVVVIEYDNNFHETERYPLHIARDMSGARWHNGYIYMVSGADHRVFKCDPNTYEALAYYDIDVINPEGIAFDPNNNVLITSDDLQRLYYFKDLPDIQQTIKQPTQ